MSERENGSNMASHTAFDQPSPTYIYTASHIQRCAAISRIYENLSSSAKDLYFILSYQQTKIDLCSLPLLMIIDAETFVSNGNTGIIVLAWHIS